MKRTVFVIIVSIFLISLCIGEQVLLSNMAKSMTTYSNNLYASIVSNKENLNSKDVLQKLTTLENYWKSEREKLCSFLNFEKIRNIDEGMTKLRNSIVNNENALAIENISIVQETGEILHLFLGFSLYNII